MAGRELILAIADSTEQIIAQRDRRRRDVAAAHDDGWSYPAMSREVSLELLDRGMPRDVLDGAGVGPDNLRKIGTPE